MDLTQRFCQDGQDFFEESVFATQLLVPNSEVEENTINQEIFNFSFEESAGFNHNRLQLPTPMAPGWDEWQSILDHDFIDDTNHLEQSFQENNQNAEQSVSQQQQVSPKSSEEDMPHSQQINSNGQLSQGQLESIIGFLVEYSNSPQNELSASFTKKFPKYQNLSIVKTLIEKFTKIKKTKQELIKYCMRKAFKFILEMPKNRHLINNEKQQKYSFSKCKSRFLKKVSEEKSMNSKFLQQIFNEGDFSSDYLIFLEKFQDIVTQDNDKKVKYLAWMLTHQKEGKKRSVQMVRRLPWTNVILQKVKKISKQLLKYSATG